MKIELHLLQSFPPSCLNRDDTNSPKDCEFGGVRRARISSQCIKRSMREYFRENNTVPVGERTKRLRAELIKRLPELPQDVLPFALDAFLEAYYSKLDSKQAGSTAVLLFLSPAEIEEAAECVRTIWEDLASVGAQRQKATENAGKKAKNKTPETEDVTEGEAKVKELPPHKRNKDIAARLENAALSPDIALFGRMLAEQPAMTREASCQVAHAISTHKSDPELDFYTAVDDLNTSDSGAGMMGLTGYNAACFYRYSLVNLPQLEKNLGDADSAQQALEAFLEAAVRAIPTGKQNSMAAQNPPSFGLFVVRESGAPASLANAFVTPVAGGNIVDASVDCLTKYYSKLNAVYGVEGIVSQALFSIEDSPLNDLEKYRTPSLGEAIANTMLAVRGNTATGAAS